MSKSIWTWVKVRVPCMVCKKPTGTEVPKGCAVYQVICKKCDKALMERVHGLASDLSANS